MTTQKNPQGTMKPNDEHDSLGWLAFRYVAGELSGDELTAFEARLDSEQSAREAVACEVELAQAVAIVAGSMTPVAAKVAVARTAPLGSAPAGRTLSYRMRGILVMAAAASVLIGMLVTQGLRPPNQRDNTRDNTAKVTPESAAQQLAGYWQAGTLVEAAPVAAENEDSLELAAHEAGGESPAYDESVPTWLLAALEPEVPADAPREN